MAWKRCPGCTRAVPTAAQRCEYCGHQWTDAPAMDLDLNLDLDLTPGESAALSSVDAAMDHAAAPLPVPPAAPAPVPPAPAAAQPAAPMTLSSWPVTPQAAPEPVIAKPAASEPVAPQPVRVERAASESTGVKPEVTTPVIPMPVAAAAGTPKVVPGASVRGRHVAMLAIGLFAGGALIFTLLSNRSAASPDSVPARPTAPGRGAAPRASAPAARTSAAPVTTARTELAPSWTHSEEGRWIPAGRKNLAVEVPAVNKIQVWTRQVTPTLVVRCSAGVIETFVYTASAARMEPQDGDHTVHLTFDGAAERTERWPDSDSHDALFARDGAAFAQDLMHAQTLKFGFTPHNANPVVATFVVSGLSDMLAPALKQCWAPQQEHGRKR